MNKNYITTALISELAMITKETENDSFKSEEITENGFKIQRITVEKECLNNLPLEKGNYSTIFFCKASELDIDLSRSLSEVISKELNRFIPKKCESIFVAGLGNRFLTSDTIGTKSIEKLEITRHIDIYKNKIFKKMNMKAVSALSPGVMAQTGIETAEIIKGIAKEISPDVIIVIDSLCARSPERLASTVQISSSGISPGSGIGNKRMKLSSESIGCPVIMLGVPTVISSSTLIYDALEKAQIDEIAPELEAVLENGQSYFVTVNEIDLLTDKLSDIISDAVFKCSQRINENHG